MHLLKPPLGRGLLRQYRLYSSALSHHIQRSYPSFISIDFGEPNSIQIEILSSSSAILAMTYMAYFEAFFSLAWSILYAVLGLLGSLALASLLLEYRQSNTLQPTHAEPPESSFARASSVGHFTLTRKWPSIMDARTAELLPKPPPVLSTHPGVAAALDRWLFYLTRDFVEPWYQWISSDTVFPDLVQYHYKTTLHALVQRLRQVSVYHLLVEKLAPLLISHLLETRKAEHAVRGSRGDRVFTESMELHELVASKYSQEKLHPCLRAKAGPEVSESQYLKSKVETLLPLLLTPNEYKSPVLSTFLRELMVKALLNPIFELLSDPYFWHQLMDSLAGTAIQDLNLVVKFRKVLEKQAEANRAPIPVHSYEDLLVLIRQCKSLVEAKRIRNIIVMEVRRRRRVLLEHPPDDSVDGVKVADLLRQVKRLLFAKAKVEKQIEELGGPSSTPVTPVSATAATPFYPTSLSQLLSHTSGLSYFMEFMETKRQANLLTFHLMAKTFREHFANPASLPPSLYQDFLQIYHQFFAVNGPRFIQLPLGLSLKLNQAAIQATTDEPFSNNLWIDAFQCILDAQNHIFQTLEQQYFGEFLRSDFYLLLLNDPAFVGDMVSAPATPSSPELDQFQLGLLQEADLLPTDAVENVEEELRSILSQELVVAPASAPGEHGSVAAGASSIGESTPSIDSINAEDALDEFTAPPSSLRQEIEKLAQQEAIVDTLLGKALRDTKRQGLIKVLEKSKRTLREEIRELLWQEQQLSRSESSHIIPGKCSVKIISHTIGRNESKEFALYRIEVRQSESGAPRWIVHRRFSEFLLLHNLLKTQFPHIIQNWDLPKKVPNALLGANLLKKLASERQQKLNEYLHRLSKSPEVCQSVAFRRFICLEHLDRGALCAHPKKSSFLKDMRRKLMQRWGALVLAEPLTHVDDTTLPPTPGSMDTLPDRASDVVCELFIEIFELRERNNWLRRQAVSILLQQILGETIERKLTESLNYYCSDQMVVFYLNRLRKSLWPGGVWKSTSKQPSAGERERIKESASQKLISFIPEILGGFVGKQNATKGALRIHSLVKNPVLNRHLLYSAFDILLEELFPEISNN